MRTTSAAFPPAVGWRSPLFRAPNFSFKNNRRQCRANLADGEEDDSDTLLLTAVFRASLRFQETNRPEPLFVDQYSGCFVPKDILQMDIKHHSHHHCVATKFIDDKLLSTINKMDGPKQVVLFTDGMDTRPYRLGWPPSTIIYDISSDIVFKKAAQALEGVGAKIQKGRFYLHVPWVLSEIEAALHIKGFNGGRQSIWILQGLPLMNLESFKEILSIVSGLAMNGCLFLGELPAFLTEHNKKNELETEGLIDKLFMCNGFRVMLINCYEVGKSLGKEIEPGESENVLFVAEQLRFSDYQMDTWRREFQRIEEDGDEEGFDEL